MFSEGKTSGEPAIGFRWQVTDGCDSYTVSEKMMLGRKFISKCWKEITYVLCICAQRRKLGA